METDGVKRSQGSRGGLGRRTHESLRAPSPSAISEQILYLSFKSSGDLIETCVNFCFVFALGVLFEKFLCRDFLRICCILRRLFFTSVRPAAASCGLQESTMTTAGGAAAPELVYGILRTFAGRSEGRKHKESE